MKIPLINRAGRITSYAVVDDDRADIAEHRWHESSWGYAVRRVGQRTIFMHRQVLGLTEPGVFADHINFDRLDNRSSNLRATTKRGNNLHSPKARGVSYEKRRHYWRAYITEYGKQTELGRFATREEAEAIARAAREQAIQEEAA